MPPTHPHTLTLKYDLSVETREPFPALWPPGEQQPHPLGAD